VKAVKNFGLLVMYILDKRFALPDKHIKLILHLQLSDWFQDLLKGKTQSVPVVAPSMNYECKYGLGRRQDFCYLGGWISDRLNTIQKKLFTVSRWKRIQQLFSAAWLQKRNGLELVNEERPWSELVWASQLNDWNSFFKMAHCGPQPFSSLLLVRKSYLHHDREGRTDRQAETAFKFKVYININW